MTWGSILRMYLHYCCSRFPHQFWLSCTFGKSDDNLQHTYEGQLSNSTLLSGHLMKCPIAMTLSYATFRSLKTSMFFGFFNGFSRLFPRGLVFSRRALTA